MIEREHPQCIGEFLGNGLELEIWYASTSETSAEIVRQRDKRCGRRDLGFGEISIIGNEGCTVVSFLGDVGTAGELDENDVGNTVNPLDGVGDNVESIEGTRKDVSFSVDNDGNPVLEELNTASTSSVVLGNSVSSPLSTTRSTR